MKKILFTIVVSVLIFIIYYFNISEKIYYTSFGDYLAVGINNFNKIENNYSDNIKNHYSKNLSKYINYSTIDDYRVMDLINDINYNKTVIYKNNEYKVQNILIKSNYITLSIGMNDILSKNSINYDYADQLLKDIENLFVLIRKFNKDRIDFLSFYNIINNKEIITYINNKLEKLCLKNNINYIDISKLNNYIINGKYPTNDGYLYITNQILNFTK